jgi:sporulation protein YlmC with PRC-barrel domain
MAALKTHDLIASDRVEGTPVKRSNGDKIGKIERVMLDKRSGKVAYAILSFGGFLGIGDKHVPIPWTKLSYSPELDAYQLDLSDEELKKAPAYDSDKEFDWGDRSQETALHTYYGISPYWAAYG